MYAWKRVDCPTCGEQAGKRCRSLITRRTTDTHVERYKLAERRGDG